jgi:hypothetical protein
MIQLLDVFIEMALHVGASGALSAASRRCLRYCAFSAAIAAFLSSVFSMTDHIDHAAAPQTTRGSADNAAVAADNAQSAVHPNLPVT